MQASTQKDHCCARTRICFNSDCLRPNLLFCDQCSPYHRFCNQDYQFSRSELLSYLSQFAHQYASQNSEDSADNGLYAQARYAISNPLAL